MRPLSASLLITAVVGLGVSPLLAREPVALRVGSFIVAPAHLPPVVVWVKNLTEAPYQGTIRVKLPEGWQFVPDEQEVSLGGGETGRVTFTVKKGVTTEKNAYPVEVTATGGGTTVVHKQQVACASAPYFKPDIDGKTNDWKDAIPIEFTTGGKKTTIGTYWSRQQFSMLVAVEEDKLLPYQAGAERPFDAVQIALAPKGAETGGSPDGEAKRFEFLLVATGEDGPGSCFLLAEPGTALAETQKPRGLAPLEYDDAELVVRRADGVTYYECSIPFKLMRETIRPSEGREFCFSLLVHDPDGAGVREWGAAAGLWPSQRSRLAWSDFQGARWGDKPPLDNKTEWGMCSSKY